MRGIKRSVLQIMYFYRSPGGAVFPSVKAATAAVPAWPGCLTCKKLPLRKNIAIP